MDFKHESVSVIRGPDENDRIYFSFREDLLHKAAEYLSVLVENGAELTLMNDKDEEGEGCTSIGFEDRQFKCQSGGHGWQGEVQSLSRNEVVNIILKLASCNMGGHWSTEAYIVLTRP